MLVLLRKVGEEIVIGKHVVVGVARVTHNRVYLTIDAPANVGVDRKEIWLAKNRDHSTVGPCKSGAVREKMGRTE